MRLGFRRVFGLILLALACSICALAQVATGAPPFATMASVSEGRIDLANLNVQTVIPVVHKAGAGIPFSYALVYNSAVWTPTSGGWQPASNLGWNVATNLLTGYETYQVTSGQCGAGYPTQMYNFTIYAGFVYTDPFGVQHSFPLVIQYPTGNPCGPQNPSSGSATATDGSGYTLTASTYGSTPTVSLASASGQGIDAPLFLAGSAITPGAGSITDPNGNEISTDGNGNFYDTLGQKALTVAGAQSPNGSMTFTYSISSGGSAQVIVHFGSYSVRTNFGCPGIAEYSAGSVPLVSEIDLPDSTKYMFSYEATPGFGGDVTGRVASIQLPTGGVISYQYTGGSGGVTCGDGSTATLTRTTPDGTWTYQHTESGSAWTTLVTDPLGNQTNYQFQGIYQTERDAYTGAVGASPLRTVYTCYNNAAAPCNGTAVVLPITQLSSITKLDNNLQAKKATTYNAYGLPLETDEYDFGSGAPGALARKTVVAYAALSGIYDHPASIEVDNGAGAKQAYTGFGYDSKGNTLSISRWVAGTTNLTTNFTVNANGTVATATDANHAVTTYSYTGSSCNGAFPTTISLPGNLSISAAWNCYVALPSSRTDANGQTTSFAYNDPFARVTQISNPDGGVTNFTYTATSTESALTFNGGTSTVDVLTTLDSLGRPHVAQRRQGPGSANFDSVETDYDADGRADSVSQAYVGAAGATAPAGTAFTTTKFDGLNRPTQTTDGGNGTLSYSYAGNDVLTALGPAPAGENTKRRQFEYNGLGELTSVCELTAASGSGTCGQTTSQTGYWTKYSYNTLGEIVGVSEDAQSGSPQTRSFAFDGLGRLTSETNPESGATAYTFDTDSTCGTSKGDLVKRVDAMGNVTCYARDALHRVTAITYPSGPYASATPSKTFVFDAATVDGQAMANAKGRLAEAFTGPASGKITDEGFGYDSMGRASDLYESVPGSSGWYHTGETYWANGAVATLVLPGIPTIAYGLDTEGRINTTSASPWQNAVNSVSYNPSGRVTSIGYGSGDSDAYQYDVNTGRMVQYRFNINGQSNTGALSWNPNGTIASLTIQDNISGTSDTQTCAYAHDDVGRLASANCGSAWGQNFSFDPFGNISKSGSLNWQPIYSASTNRANIGYDADGNTTNDGTNSYQWDAEGRPVNIAGSAENYDAIERMVTDGYSSEEIVRSPDGVAFAMMGGQGLAWLRVPLSGGNWAAYTPSGPWFVRQADWLGTDRLASRPDHSIWSSEAYAPYGETYASTNQDWMFTGSDADVHRDAASGLFDFPYREYSVAQGRWLSPDPAGLAAVNPADPQTWNKYAYVENQPLSVVDPSGLGPITFAAWCEINNDPIVCGGWDLLGGGMEWGHPKPYSDAKDDRPQRDPTHPGLPAPKSPTPAQVATNYCEQHGQLYFNIPFTHIPITISLSATLFGSYGSTNDISVTLPPSAGASLDITVGAPKGPDIPVQVGSGKNLSVGTYLTPSGPVGFSLSLGPSVGSPVTVSPQVANACGLIVGGG